MAKAKVKTVETRASVNGFVEKMPEAQRRKDANAIITLMSETSGYEPKMWGPAIIGFGSYHYKYDSGREGDAPLVAFSPRKSEFALYLTAQFEKRDELLKQLGKHKAAKACIYVKKLEDINIDVLKKMIKASLKDRITKHK